MAAVSNTLKPPMKKNCHTCHHLEWVDGEGNNAGYDCGKRHEQMYQNGQEDVLLANLDRPEYRNLFKRCFEPKPQGN